MHETARQAADGFLAQTYGFDAETRFTIIERAAREIGLDCRELLAAAATGGSPAKRSAHRLKGHLLALGLTDLAGRAREIERLADQSAGAAFTAAVRALCRDLLRHPPE